MEASIIAIGDEILIGQVLDTNSQYISQNLQTKAIKVNLMLSCSDNYEDIWKTINYAFQISDLVFITGGLGPTNDDITKKLLCDYFEDRLYFDDNLYRKISERYKKIGVKITKNNKNQALLPKKAKIFSNEIGSAQGMMFEKNGKFLFSLPGVPAEMFHIFENDLSKYLDANFSGSNIFHKTFILTDISESLLAEKIKIWEDSLPDYIKLAYLPSYSYLKIRISCYNLNKIKEDFIENKIIELKKIIFKYIISDIDESIEELLGRLLKKQNATLSTAESCTGGRIASSITRIAGASDYFKGTVVAYSNDVKINILSVDEKLIIDYGAVSEQVVTEMAVNVRKIMNSDYSIATSGIAGLSGGSLEKPIGTIWIAIVSSSKIYTFKNSFTNIRELNILRATNIAIVSLIKILLNK